MTAFPAPRFRLFPLFVRRRTGVLPAAAETLPAEPVTHAEEFDAAWRPVPATTREILLPSLVPEHGHSAGPRRSRRGTS